MVLSQFIAPQTKFISHWKALTKRLTSATVNLLMLLIKPSPRRCRTSFHCQNDFSLSTNLDSNEADFSVTKQDVLVKLTKLNPTKPNRQQLAFSFNSQLEIRHISVASNAIQTKDSAVTYLLIYCLNCI